METVLKIAGVALGLVVPALLIYVLAKGIARSPLDAATKSRSLTTLVIVIGAWTAGIFAASIAGLFEFHPGDPIPRFLIPLFVPVLIGIAALGNKTFRTIVDSTPLSVLAGAQAFRFAGAVLFVIPALGILPNAFMSGGAGDVVTGLLAILAARLIPKGKQASNAAFWGLMAVGIVDLLNVLALLLMYYPGWYASVPNSAPASAFSLVMLPALAAPIALLFHFYAILNRLKGSESRA